MNLNSQYSYYPPQPDNPSDGERHFLLRYALTEVRRPEDFNYIVSYLQPPVDVARIASPGSCRGLKVGVVGGGLAGLAAAFELRKLGFDITVLDALEDRVGGRVYTYYFDEQKEFYGEFGPMRIPVAHETVWHYIKLFRLPTRPFIQVDHNAFAYLKYVRVRNDADGLNVKKYIYPLYQLSRLERDTSWQELLFWGQEGSILAATPQERTEIIRVLPRYSAKTLEWDAKSNLNILEESGLSEPAIDLVTNFNPLLRGSFYNSYIDLIEENYPANLSYLYEIPGGIVRLPEAFINSFADHFPAPVYPGIHPGHLGRVNFKNGFWVEGIYFGQNEKVILEYRNRKTNEKTYDSFDYVVCAIPFSSLRNVKIEPLFSNIKMRAIREVNYATAQKTILYCRSRFWEKQGILGGASYTDLPINSIWYTADKKMINSDMPGVILVYNFENDATRLTNMPPERFLTEVKREIEAVHGLPEGYLDTVVQGIKTVNWDEQPEFRGSLCFFAPEQKRLFSYAKTQPEYGGRVFFAGEHISATHRWMQGALQSGMQAANQIACACVRRQSGIY